MDILLGQTNIGRKKLIFGDCELKKGLFLSTTFSLLRQVSLPFLPFYLLCPYGFFLFLLVKILFSSTFRCTGHAWVPLEFTQLVWCMYIYQGSCFGKFSSLQYWEELMYFHISMPMCIVLLSLVHTVHLKLCMKPSLVNWGVPAVVPGLSVSEPSLIDYSSLWSLCDLESLFLCSTPWVLKSLSLSFPYAVFAENIRHPRVWV